MVSLSSAPENGKKEATKDKSGHFTKLNLPAPNYIFDRKVELL